MKKYTLIYLALITFSCSEPKQVAVNQYSLQDISTNLEDEKYKTIVNNLKAFYITGNETRSFGQGHTNLTEKFVSEIDKYELATFSYYQFDNKKFYDNPSEENLQACMFPLDKLNIIAFRDGKPELRVIVEQEKNTKLWLINRLTPRYGKTISWLSDSLSNAGTKTCKIFLHGSTREFVTYEKDGTPLYFRITGEPISAAHLCEYFIENYKKWLTQEKYIKEHSELFGDDPTLNE